MSINELCEKYIQLEDAIQQLRNEWEIIIAPTNWRESQLHYVKASGGYLKTTNLSENLTAILLVDENYDPIVANNEEELQSFKDILANLRNEMWNLYAAYDKLSFELYTLSLDLRKELGDIAYNFTLNDRMYTFYHDQDGLMVTRK